MNLTVALIRTNYVTSLLQFTSFLSQILPLVNDSEALFRVLVGLGTLLLESPKSLSLPDQLKKCTLTVLILTKATESKENKVAEVSRKILELIV